jgi:hypothetical protein
MFDSLPHKVRVMIFVACAAVMLIFFGIVTSSGGEDGTEVTPTPTPVFVTPTPTDGGGDPPVTGLPDPDTLPKDTEIYERETRGAAAAAMTYVPIMVGWDYRDKVNYLGSVLRDITTPSVFKTSLDELNGRDWNKCRKRKCVIVAEIVAVKPKDATRTEYLWETELKVLITDTSSDKKPRTETWDVSVKSVDGKWVVSSAGKRK